MKYLAYLAALLLLSLAFAQPAPPSNFRLVYPGPPTPAMVAARNLPTVGPITAVAGQTISNVRVVNPTGPCIVVNVPNVTIQDSEIGPCGDGSSANHLAIVSIGATNIKIRRNVIHDAASAAYLTAANHPFVFHKNYVYNIRGPFPRGAMIQTNGITGGTGSSKVTCNVSDTMPGVRHGVEHGAWQNVEDHINFFNSGGVDSGAGRTEIAYNRLRGGHPTSTTGSGINSGDGPSGGNTYSHDNIIVNVRNVGIAIVNGPNHTHDNNRVYMSRTPWPGTDWGNGGCAAIVGPGTSCTGSVMSNNRIRAIGLTSHCEGNPCQSGVTFTNNNYADTSLTEAMFDEPWPAACN